MQSLCIPARSVPDHWAECQADAVIIASELIPALCEGSLSYADVRLAIAGMHECHVVALVLELASEMAMRGLTPADMRHVTLAHAIDRAVL